MNVIFNLIQNLRKNYIIRRYYRTIIFFILFQGFIYNQDKYLPFNEAIRIVKSLNFTTFTAGIISFTATDAFVDSVKAMQIEPPRQMKLYIVRSEKSGELFRSFTKLVRELKVEIIFILPSEDTQDKQFIKKICTMSKKKKIPLIAFQDGWIEEGAMMVLTNDNDSVVISINDKMMNYFDYPLIDNKDYKIIKK